MQQPIPLPVAPMLAKAMDAIPAEPAGSWWYEPKWDGFRCIVCRDGDEIVLSSRNERPFNRYFPELLEPLKAVLPVKCVVDGEIVLPAADGNGLDFDALLQRIHPAESRVRRLSVETPAVFVAFDLLALGDQSLLDTPLSTRLDLLASSLFPAEAYRPHGVAANPPSPGPARPMEGFGDRGWGQNPPSGGGSGPTGEVAPRRVLFRCPGTTDPAVATDWFHRFEGAGLDGVIAKRLVDVYTPDQRTLVKVKHRRTADCVIAGYRVHKDGKGVGSLLLGLHDHEGRLHHVGVAASFTAKRRSELLVELEPYTHDALSDHPWREWAEAEQQAAAQQRMPGATSRWNAGKDLGWVPLRPELVAEVTFGQLQEGRFRHGSTFVCWRTDRTPHSCRYDQLEVATPVPLSELLGDQ